MEWPSRLGRVISALSSLASLAACGDDGSAGDASPVDSATTLVRVRALDNNDAGVGGVRVFGHDASGAKLDEDVTGLSGLAQVRASVGGSITTLVSAALQTTEDPIDTWLTILDVGMGDDIVIRIPMGSPSFRETTISVPDLPSGATRGLIHAPCGGGGIMPPGQPILIRTDRRCPSRGTITITAEDDQGTPYGYIVIPDADLTQLISTTGPWVTPTLTFGVDVTSIPAGGGTMTVHRRAIAAMYPVHLTSLALSTTTSAASATRFRPDVGDAALYDFYGTTNTSTSCEGQALFGSKASTSVISQVTFDVGDSIAPISGLQVVDHEVSWVGGGDGLAVRVGIAAAQSTRETIQGPERGWSVIAPAGVNRVRFPADVDFSWPVAAESGDRALRVGVTELASSQWGSYADYRQGPNEWSPRVVGDLTTRGTSAYRNFTITGCPFIP